VPVLALRLSQVSLVVRATRSSMLEVLGAESTHTGRAQAVNLLIDVLHAIANLRVSNA
jgi:ABC-type dipeptide/oligopeptide/nickel transport system permease component